MSMIVAVAAFIVVPAKSDPIVERQSLLAMPTAPDGSKIVDARLLSDRHIRLDVWSAAMDRVVPMHIQRPADTSQPRPVLYLLNGAGGGEDDATWNAKTDALGFLSDKNVNVVQVIGGRGSYYADWIKADPKLGVNKWSTFLTRELPPIVDGALGTNGLNAIAGLSASATSVLALPIAAPGLYRATASYSGCAQTSDPLGAEFVKTTVSMVAGGDVENMWGPIGSEEWRRNDPLLNAEGLRGLEIYVSSGNGLPGQHDVLNGEYALPGPIGLGNQMVVGGVIEAATNLCTHNLKRRLDELNIPATYNLRPAGTHSWGYWMDDLIASWPVLARGIGL
ncbi:alpha/beta hydrolase [Nocardia inohanensis]|uniref:alpha/beta hydrolase n=1 Tax=Nocardia inohanensis TaxID=209246 RepID=UPI0008330E46